jgi:hypothetical protein
LKRKQTETKSEQKQLAKVVLFWNKANGEWGWHKYGDEKKDGKYSGEVKNGEPHGQGTETYPSGEKYVGEWKDGYENGQGTKTWISGAKYVGEWNEGNRDGQGTYTWSNGGRGVGEFRNNHAWNTKGYDKEGNLIATYINGVKTKVENKQKQKQKRVIFWNHAYGKWGWHKYGDEKKDKKYSGEVKNGEPNGQGTYTWPDGGRYEGEIKYGQYHGQGTYTWSNGGRYVGEFKNGKSNGQGTLTFPDGDKYVGEFKNWEYHGQGTLTLPDGDKIVGEFRNNKEWNTKEYGKEGNLIFTYVNGELKELTEYHHMEDEEQNIFSATGVASISHQCVKHPCARQSILKLKATDVAKLYAMDELSKLLGVTVNSLKVTSKGKITKNQIKTTSFGLLKGVRFSGPVFKGDEVSIEVTAEVK